MNTVEDDKFSDELLRMMEAQNAMDEFSESDSMLEDYETSEDEQDEDQSQDASGSQSTTNRNTDIIWSSERFQPNITPFQERPLKLNPALTNEDAKELDYFLYYFDHEIMAQIVANINQTYNEFLAEEGSANNSRLKKWHDVTIPEFYIFLTICMLMTRNKRLKLDEHWSTDHLLYSPIFGTLMGRTRFSTILYLLRTPTSTSQINIIDILINHARNKFRTAMKHPSKTLTVDEYNIPLKGAVNRREQKKTGVKLFFLKDLKTGLIIDFTLYFGAEKTDQYILNSLKSSETVIVSLLKKFFNSHRHLYVDERYTSPRLFKYLYENNIYACGKTIRNKAGMPNFIRNLEPGEVSVGYCPPLTAIQWHLKSYTYFLSTIHDDSLTQTTKKDKVTGNLITKPNASIDYSKNMHHNADTTDFMMSTSRSLCPLHWHKKLLFHIVDMHLLNAFNCFKMVKDQGRTSFAQFQLKLIRKLIEAYNNGQVNLDKPMKVNRCINNPVNLLPPTAAQHMPARAEKYQRCKVCAKQKKRKDTRYMCTICQVYLCACPCFQIHHAQ